MSKKKFKNWFRDLRNKTIDGYICPIFPNDETLDSNIKALTKFEVRFIKFKIPFLDEKNHIVDLAFIPKEFQANLDFLSWLTYVLPIKGIFKKRIFQGFRPDDYDLLELWTKSVYDEISTNKYQSALMEDQEQMQEEAQKAQETLAKIEKKREQKAQEKLAKQQEREAKKQEEKARKQAEREQKKAEKEKAKQNANKTKEDINKEEENANKEENKE